jgi:hypothetical protein
MIRNGCREFGIYGFGSTAEKCKTYAEQLKPCPLLGDYCDNSDKDCNRCIAEEEQYTMDNVFFGTR